jgi:hypothetical protein
MGRERGSTLSFKVPEKQFTSMYVVAVNSFIVYGASMNSSGLDVSINIPPSFNG